MTLATLRRLFLYDAWANRGALRSIRAAAAPPPRAVAILAHLVAAGRLWLDRLLGVPSSVAVWPDLTPDQIETALRDLEETWAAYLSRLEERDLGRVIGYTNSKGQRFNIVLQSRVLELFSRIRGLLRNAPL